MTEQMNMKAGPWVPHHCSTMESHLIDITSMNPPIFFGWKEDEDPQDFSDEVYKILFSIVVTPQEKAELVTYQLKEVALSLYTQ